MSSFQFHASRDGTASIASIVEMASRSAARVRRIRNCLVVAGLRELVPVSSDEVDRFSVVSDVADASITMAMVVLISWLLIHVSTSSALRLILIAIITYGCGSTVDCYPAIGIPIATARRQVSSLMKRTDAFC